MTSKRAPRRCALPEATMRSWRWGVLEAAQSAATGARATSLAFALAQSYSRGGHDNELLAAAKRLSHDVPTSDKGWYFEMLALANLGRAQQARDEAAARLAKDPTNPARLSDLSFAEAAIGHYAEARRIGEQLIATQQGGAGAYNSEAWAGLFTTVTEKDLTYALNAVNAAPKDAGYLNTLAAIDAALGHTADAHDRIVSAIELRTDKQPGPERLVRHR